jgi:hypothetical protein
VTDPFYRLVKGAWDGLTEATAKNAAEDLAIILEKPLYKSHRIRCPLKTSLANYIPEATSEGPSWPGSINAFRKTVTELKKVRKLRDISRRSIFQNTRTSYMCIVWRSISIDLVAASLRQREFAKKITGTECHRLDSQFGLLKAVTRYHRFLLLMKHSDSKKTLPLVPTLDIDLCWHTHQLSPVSYRQWCTEHLGTAINHDDTIGKSRLHDGLRQTSLAWFHAYGEDYTTDDLRSAYLTGGRKVAGIVLRKLRKLDLAEIGICLIISEVF